MTNTTTLFVGGYTPNNDFFINGRDFVGFGQTVRGNGAGTTEVNVQRSTSVSCTLQNIGCQVVLSNTGANTTGWWSRVGAADGNQTAVLSGSVTGYIQDTTHTDSLVASTSLWNAAFKGVSAGPDCEITSHNVVVLNSTPLQEYAWGCQASVNGNALTFTTNQNHFLALQGGSGAAGDSSETTESDNTKLLLRAPGTYSALQATLTTNTSGSVIKFHLNGADGNQTLSPGTTASAVNTRDTTHTDSIVSGDKANYRINANASITMAIIFLGGSFVGTTSAHDIFATAGGSSISTTAFFFAVGGSWGANNAAESQSQIKCHTACTWDRLRFRLSSNSISIAEPFISRAANANGNQTVTAAISSGATTIEDTTHTDSVAADALVNIKYNPTGSPTGSIAWAWYGSRFDDGSNTGSVNVTATGTIGTITLTAATGSATGTADITATGSIGTITLTAPTGSAGGGATGSGAIGTITLTAPSGTGRGDGVATGSIGTITMIPPYATVEHVTQMGLTALTLNSAIDNVTQMGNNALATNRAAERVTSMGLLVLAKGGESPLTPDPLNLMDMGRKPPLRQRLVNMYVEPTPQGPAATVRYQRPGLYEVAERGGGPLACTFLFQGFRITVSGGSVWRDATNIGTIPVDSKTRFAVSNEECVIVAGHKAWYVTLTGVTRIEDTDLPDVIDVCFIAGRFIYVHASSDGQFSWSALNDAQTIDGLAFASAESNPDPLTGCMVTGDNIFFPGSVSGEWWYPVSDITAPFQRSKGRRYDKGCPAIRTLTLADNAVYFLGNDRMIYRAGSDPQRVSTFDVEDKLRKVTDADLPDVTAWTCTFGGHVFVIFNLPHQGSWALDVGQRLWAEWRTWNKDRFRIDFADNNFFGDLYTGKILGFDGDTFTDLGDPIERICSSFAALKSGHLRNFNLTLYCMQGVGLATGYGSEPVVEMHMSDHLGEDWTVWQEEPLGEAGDTSKGSLANWTSLGSISAPGRLFEFRCTDPVRFTPYMLTYNEVQP